MESLALLTALALLATAVLGFLEKLRRDVRRVQVTVNSRMEETLIHLREQKDLHIAALARIDQLDEVLREAGIRSPNHLQRGAHERDSNTPSARETF